MGQQPARFATPAPAPARYSLFLAIFPDPCTARRILKRATVLRDEYGLSGKLRPLDHLHVTLHYMGRYSVVPARVGHAIGQICEAPTALMPSFEVTFDQVMSFRGRAGNRPFVLIGKNGNPALLEFHRLLLAEFAKHQWPKVVNSKFNPHVTLLYDKKNIEEKPIDPVSWTVGEIALVCSEVGATKYHRLGRWMLGD